MAKENNNKSFVLRIDAATMDALELWAADEFRSINGQLQWIIADASTILILFSGDTLAYTDIFVMSRASS